MGFGIFSTTGIAKKTTFEFAFSTIGLQISKKTTISLGFSNKSRPGIAKGIFHKDMSLPATKPKIAWKITTSLNLASLPDQK